MNTIKKLFYLTFMISVLSISDGLYASALPEYDQLFPPPPAFREITITIVRPHQEVRVDVIEDHTTIGNIKQQIAAKTGIAVDKQTLRGNGKELLDDEKWNSRMRAINLYVQWG